MLRSVHGVKFINISIDRAALITVPCYYSCVCFELKRKYHLVLLREEHDMEYNNNSKINLKKIAQRL